MLTIHVYSFLAPRGVELGIQFEPSDMDLITNRVGFNFLARH